MQPFNVWFLSFRNREHPLVLVDPYHSSSQTDSVRHRAGDYTRPTRHIKNVLAGSNLNRIRDPFRPLEKQRWKVELLIDFSGVTRHLPFVEVTHGSPSFKWVEDL